MVRFVAVIDLGKTNSKVALVDTINSIEVQVIKQPTPESLDSPYLSMNTDAIEEFILNSLRELSSQHTIDAITVTTHGATAALINESGQLAMPVVDYEFLEIDELREEYEHHRPEFSDSGSPSLPGGLNIGAQLFWQQKKHHAQFQKAHTVLTWPQYWVFKLTGNRHNDVTSLGCHTDLYEPYKRQYSSLTKHQNWQALMPPTKRSGEISGNLIETVANKIGLPPSLPVHTGIHDSNASLVPHLVNQPAPFSVVSTGTWFISMAIGGKSVELDETKDTLINVNAYDECVPSARFMGGRERETFHTQAAPSEQAMNTLLDHPEPMPLLMPSAVQNTGPYPNAKQQWVGSSLAGDLETQSCATTLYLALMTHECLLLIGACGPTFIEGPLSHDPYYAKMLAVVSNRPVQLSNAQTGTSVGAAMLINAPKNPPIYTEVIVNNKERLKLAQYAKLWKRQLNNHCAKPQAI